MKPTLSLYFFQCTSFEVVRGQGDYEYKHWCTEPNWARRAPAVVCIRQLMFIISGGECRMLFEDRRRRQKPVSPFRWPPCLPSIANLPASQLQLCVQQLKLHVCIGLKQIKVAWMRQADALPIANCQLQWEKPLEKKKIGSKFRGIASSVLALFNKQFGGLQLSPVGNHK